MLEVHDALELAPVREPPVAMAGEARWRVERGDLHGERVRPGVMIVLVVDGAVVGELLPHEPGVAVGDRAVAVVEVAPRLPGPDVAVLAGSRAGDRGPRAVPTRGLPGGGEARHAPAGVVRTQGGASQHTAERMADTGTGRA